MSIEFIRERSFENNGLTFAAKEWGRSGYPPVIALHGWLDNANTFDRMLPHMENVHVIALDLAGHGRSDFRSRDSGYDIWHDIADVMAVADQMGWETFGLIGHSRGAIISGLVAGTYPERVTSAALIDGYMPLPEEAHNTAKHFARAIHENKRFAAASATGFQDYDRAILARVNGFVKLEQEAAAILAERGVEEIDGLFYWRNDQRLKAASMIKLSKDHLHSFLSAINGRVLLIQAENSVFSPSDKQSEAFDWIPHMEIVKMPGSHHLHLEGQAEQVAVKVQTLFS
ncbi:alpha/beta hydrolase [Porticoccaceae bacterium]|jgi:pimeloyl-ACP methyl ester carboxylesterase|nr:alpha/beta hydrolase [Porticoccaceae bacterium]MDC1476577.1 alpha/beta hydrolase [Porticoccaceae bacterium]|tara:strand:- start:32 stop:889 length:858 start_codon:yes stop_codon:yes gene_type:complete